MRLRYTDIYRSRAYRRADHFGRRMTDIRLTVAFALRQERKQRGWSQRKLAEMLDAAPSTISRLERASPRVTLDQAVRAFLVLGMDDVAISAAFNPLQCPQVCHLRARTKGRWYY
jgi:ribosome-binding protein aMBF1 (putative translation factor)